MPRTRRRSRWLARLEGNGALLTLSALLVAAFLTGGGSRGDIVSLVLLRPFAVLCLALGLSWISRDHWNRYRLPLALMSALIGLHVLHLIPLPPAMSTALPGREIAATASALVGAEDVWRPLAMVPYRAWNAFS